MLAVFFVCFCIGTNVHAGVIATSISTPATPGLVDSTPVAITSESFDEDAELKKIAESCFSTSNYEQLAGYTFRHSIARGLGGTLMRESVATIGLTELRAALNLEPLPPWQHYNYTDPSDSDLASAPSIQAYYDLIEPRSLMRSLDSYVLYEHNLNPAIVYLDKRFPSIRKMFKRRFETISQSCGRVTDRKAIDRAIYGFYEVREKVRNAMFQMGMRDDEC